ncbi:MAG: C13 family peptidase [Bacteroidota bacterium]|nr:C13 family peptidase [Bacteroidota bacterium]
MINGSYDSSPLDLDGDGDDDIQFAATRANITSVFNTLADLINSDDNLFIYTTDHGGQESGQDAIMYLWNQQQLLDNELSIEVNKINAQRINIVMEQCYSGGFLDDLQNNNRVIATACRFDESSYATNDFLYDEFIYHWTAAIAGELPNGTIVDADANNDNFVSMLEAFNYAKNLDTKNEHPQYSSIPTTTGQYLTLLGIIPTLTGPSTVCSSNSTFTIQNRPPNSTITWSKSSNLTYVSGQGTNNYTVRANGNGNGWVQANINGAIFRKEFSVGKPLPPYINNGTTTNTSSTVDYNLTYGSPSTSLQLSYVDQPESAITSNYINQITSGSDNFELVENETSVIINPTNVGTGSFIVKSENQCGISSSYTTVNLTITSSSNTGGHGGLIDLPGLPTKFTITPNPASDYLTVTIESDETKMPTSKALYQVKNT